MEINEEYDIDTLHPQIYQYVVEEIPRAVESYLDLVKDRREILKIASREVKAIDVNKFELENLSKYKISAADGGGNGKELEGFYFGLVAAIAFTSMGFEEDFSPISIGRPLLWDDEFDIGRRAAAIRDRLMYDVAKLVIQRNKPDVLLLDGPLIPNTGYIPTSDDSNEYVEDFEKMMHSLFSLLESVAAEFEDRGMLFACIVKRVRSERYSKLLGLPRGIRDSSLLNPILKVGQRTELIEPSPGRMLKEVFPPEHRMVKQFFIKTSNLGPIRVEIPSYLDVKVDELSSLLYSTADPLTGIPFHILRADTLTRVNIPTTDLTYTRFISHIMDRVKRGELSTQDLDMLNLRRFEIWRL